MENPNKERNTQEVNFVEPEGFTKMWVFVLLYIITFGIYLFFWIYKTVGLLNKKTGNQDGQVQQLLLCIFVPFYTLYWIYKYSNRLVGHCNRIGFRVNSISTTCMVLAICGMVATVLTFVLFYSPIGWVISIAGYVCTIVAYALIQNTINGCLLHELAQGRSSIAYSPPTYTTPSAGEYISENYDYKAAQTNGVIKNGVNNTSQQMNSDADIVNQLRELKTLYDEGVITEDEFNYKKRDLLK